MIRLQIESEGYDVDDGLRSRIQDKLGDLDTYLAALDRGHVVLSWDGRSGGETRVRAQLSGPGHHFEASDTHRDAATAVDRTRHRLEAQIRREHDKEISQRDRR
jgi:ribosomal subunit interface protein